MINKFPFPVIVFGRNGKTHYTNSKFTEFSGYGLREIPTRQAWTRKCLPVSSTRRQPARRADARAVFGERELGGRKRRIVCSDGSVKDRVVYSLHLKNGKECVIIADTTQLEESQKELEASRERFRTVYKNSPVPIFLWQRQGDDFTLVDFSLSASAFTKTVPDNWIGARLSKLFEDMPFLVDDVRRCFSKRATVRNEYPYTLRTTSERRYVASFYTFIPPDLVLIYFIDVTEYKKIEKSLKENEKRLELETRKLEEANTALKVLLDYRAEEKRRIQENVVTTVAQLILPFVEKLYHSSLDDQQRVLVDAVKSNLAEITSPMATKLSYRHAGLSPMELAVANLVRIGKSIKEAAHTLGITEDTVRFHRKNIRAKLGLKQKKLNLYSYLQQVSSE
jgi:DNA-binding CsgD family transcriptional regulator/PAS domain-containing protein